MYCVGFLVKAVVLSLLLAPGFNTNQVPNEDDLTILIDYVKYQKLTKSHRTQRQYHPFLRQFDPTRVFRLPSIFPTPPTQHPQRDRHNDCDDKDCGRVLCDDPINEVYQSCGSKCVLGCRYAATTSTSVSISKYECEKNDCVEGCFCKTGLVRHQTKCIPAGECPVRKCNNRNEVYMCGPAAPITCDNALRANEILDLTRHVKCVWGCYCAQGYLRNNYNGKCVSENECRNTKFIDISPQIPGLFKHIQSPVDSGCDSNGCAYIDHSGDGCGQYGCGSTDEDGEDNGENSGWPISGGSIPGGFLPGIPLLNWSGKVTHFHHWNDTNGSNGGENSPDGCAGKFGCNGELPTTSISLENGTTITIPILPGTQIDVAAGTINTSPPDKDSQNDALQSDADVLDEVEDDFNESEVQINRKPSDGSATTASHGASKPDASPHHNNINPFANQYLQYPNFAFNPNAPSFAQPQNYPHSSQFYQSSQNPHAFGTSSGPSPFPPPNYFNQPISSAPPRTVVVKSPSKGSASMTSQDKNSKEESNVDESESEHQSNTESPTSDGIQSTMPTPIPQKNQEPSKNQIPSNYLHPYFNYFNTYNPNNPNQYYQNNFNGGKNPNIPQQYIDPNQQFNQFNPQYNPYNYQAPSNYYSNPQFSTNQGVVNSNKKKQRVKHRPNENENQPTTESTTFKYSYNRRGRPTTQKKPKPNHGNSHKTEEMVEKIEVIDADKDFDSEE